MFGVRRVIGEEERLRDGRGFVNQSIFVQLQAQANKAFRAPENVGNKVQLALVERMSEFLVKEIGARESE
jgi:hypothetical protein